jgi:hypothetical protein
VAFRVEVLWSRGGGLEWSMLAEPTTATVLQNSKELVLSTLYIESSSLSSFLTLIYLQKARHSALAFASMTASIDEKSQSDTEAQAERIEDATNPSNCSTATHEDFDFTFGKLLAVLVSSRNLSI